MKTGLRDVLEMDLLTGIFDILVKAIIECATFSPVADVRLGRKEMSIWRLLVVTVLCLNLSNALAGNLKDAPVIFKEGDCSVRRTTDMMSDKKVCVGLYKDGFYTQVTGDIFSVSLRGRGGVRGYTYRIDDAAPTKMKPANDTEKKASAMYLEGDDFRQLLSSKRFRLQVVTMLSSIVEEDIDLTGLPRIYGVLTGVECK